MTHHLNEKFLLYLNDALAMENAALDRIELKVNQTILEDSKQQLQHHLGETIEQQNRLRNIITKLGGTPTKKAGLPILTSPESILKTMKKMMSTAERDLKECEQDTIIENAEVTGYNMLIQWAIKLGIPAVATAGDAIPLLRQSLAEEEKRIFF